MPTFTGEFSLGVLSPWGRTTLAAGVVPGGVWHFWVDNTTFDDGSATRVTVESVITERQGNAHRVLVTVRNVSNRTAGFNLRFSVSVP